MAEAHRRKIHKVSELIIFQEICVGHESDFFTVGVLFCSVTINENGGRLMYLKPLPLPPSENVKITYGGQKGRSHARLIQIYEGKKCQLFTLEKLLYVTNKNHEDHENHRKSDFSKPIFSKNCPFLILVSSGGEPITDESIELLCSNYAYPLSYSYILRSLLSVTIMQ